MRLAALSKVMCQADEVSTIVRDEDTAQSRGTSKLLDVGEATRR
jgi:hypothetical protein